MKPSWPATTVVPAMSFREPLASVWFLSAREARCQPRGSEPEPARQQRTSVPRNDSLFSLLLEDDPATLPGAALPGGRLLIQPPSPR